MYMRDRSMSIISVSICRCEAVHSQYASSHRGLAIQSRHSVSYTADCGPTVRRRQVGQIATSLHVYVSLSPPLSLSVSVSLCPARHANTVQRNEHRVQRDATGMQEGALLGHLG